MEKRDITSLDDVKLLVDTFYGTVRQNELIGPIFEETIQDRWPVHLEKMYRFWQTILLDDHTYVGAPFAPHARLPIHAEHFADWLEIFHSTVNSLFEGEVAEEAKWRAGKMADMFQMKLSYFRNQEGKAIF